MRNTSPSAQELLTKLQIAQVSTPAYVFSEDRLAQICGIVAGARATGCQVLYAIKAQTFADVIAALGPAVNGFSVSSLYEAKFVRELWPDAPIHFTSPGLHPSEFAELGRICDYVSMNSVNQLQTYGTQFDSRTSVGVRINTGISFVSDVRYDPCRPVSKLGMPVSALQELYTTDLCRLIHGLHFHTNSDSNDFDELLANAQVLVEKAPANLRVEWVNMGGGYLLDEVDSFELLGESVRIIRQRFECEVFIEPGAALVRSAGFLVASVIDMFEADGKKIAVLDTTVNHMPEVLEFDYRPEIDGDCDEGNYCYEIVGCTCLAGDIFGSYRFAEPIKLGSRIVFYDAGAYSLVKAHRFNGVNLPAVYIATSGGEMKLRKSFSYDDFAVQWLPNE